MSEPIRFFVPGIPRPGGSKTGFPIRAKDGVVRVAMKDASNNKDWKGAIVAVAASAWPNPPLACAVEVSVAFFMPRPKDHYRANGELKQWAIDVDHVKAPDATKLWRCAEDALTGVLWVDDRQITRQVVCKRYGERTGMDILVLTLRRERIEP